jgi:hypothetical protein
LSKGQNDDRSAASNIEQDKADPSQEEITSSHDQTATNIDSNDNVITITNHKSTLQSFIQSSPLGVQFAIIVLFHLARAFSTSSNKSRPSDPPAGGTDLSPFSFTSKEFFDTYMELASEMGLTKYLLRHMAFAEFMLTMEYLALVREDELTANYRFKVDFEDLKWLACSALQQIAGGYGLSSPEIFFFPSPPRPALPHGTPQLDKNVYPPTMANTETTAGLIKDLSLSIFS